MRLDLLFAARMKSSFRDVFSLVFIILAMAVSVSAAVFILDKAESELCVAIVSEDEGSLSGRFLYLLSDNNSFSMREMSYGDAMRQLYRDKLEAVVLIGEDFSEKLAKGDYKNTLSLYISPSSQAVATLSEPLITAVLMVWLEEESLSQTRDFLADKGKEFSEADEASQRGKINALWESGAVIEVSNVFIGSSEKNAAETDPFSAYLRWYGALSMFYLVVGASWVLDINKKGLRVRSDQTGVRQWRMILSTGAAPVILCSAGYIVSATICCAMTGDSYSNIAVFFLPMLLYLIGILGMTLFMASLVRHIFSLMFLAPLVTFLSGVLSGLFITLPDWAYMLETISRLLPGRWLSAASTGPITALPGAAICSVVWMGAGIAVSVLSTRRSPNQ